MLQRNRSSLGLSNRVNQRETHRNVHVCALCLVGVTAIFRRKFSVCTPFRPVDEVTGFSNPAFKLKELRLSRFEAICYDLRDFVCWSCASDQAGECEFYRWALN